MTTLLLALIACGGTKMIPHSDDTDSDTDTDTDSSFDTDTDDTADTGPSYGSFTDDVFPIFTERCIICHEVWGDADNAKYTWERFLDKGNADNTLVVPYDLENSWFYQKMLSNPVQGRQMPMQSYALSGEQQQDLYDWIAGGAAEEDMAAGFEDVYEQDGHCKNCHDTFGDSDLYTNLINGESGGYSYVVPGSPEDSLLYLKVSESSPPVGDPMPISYDLSSDEELEAIASWIEAGAPYN